MPTSLSVITNEDDALLVWSIDAPIPQCRGFAISRRIQTRKQTSVVERFLENRVGFVGETVTPGQTKPSDQWPFQRFSWTDHDADTGDTVSYQVVPVIRSAGGDLGLKQADASAWSQPQVLGVMVGDFEPFFNRGFVISQFMARYLKERGLTLEQFKHQISEADDTTIRGFLSGDLRTRLLQEIEQTKQDGGELFAALFELSDPELLEALAGLGQRAHVVLANGSITKLKGESTEEARKRDENKDARKTLIDKQVDVGVVDRFIAPGPLGHNKFFARTDTQGRTVAAWTGSTNWTPTGLCTQVNNGLLIKDAAVAQMYRDQWDLLRQARSDFPAKLVTSNNTPKAAGPNTPGSARSVVWFTRTAKGVDLDALRAEVQAARRGILFLMFQPGSAGLFSAVAAASADSKLYVRGVVSELPNSRGDESAVDVNIIDGTRHTPLHLDIIQPEGAEQTFAGFAAEVTHNEFRATIGWAIVHSKVVVVDAFSDDPTVITGSHNFSVSASSKNDENFIIVKGDRALARAYAVNIYGAYAHYRWRAYLAQTNKPFEGLQDNDSWQRSKLRSTERERQFWGVKAAG
jgi:phosphatidylserine/phosphatidylglycerophosphate/cardiolipin synthase-like enzyme